MFNFFIYIIVNCFACSGHRGTEAQRHRGTETQRHRDTETQRHRDTETQRHRDTETQRHRDTETQRHNSFLQTTLLGSGSFVTGIPLQL